LIESTNKKNQINHFEPGFDFVRLLNNFDLERNARTLTMFFCLLCWKATVSAQSMVAMQSSTARQP